MNGDDPAKRRQEAKERLQQRSANRVSAEEALEQARLNEKRLGDHLIEKPALAVPILIAAAVAPEVVRAAQGPEERADIGLHDFIDRHPRLCFTGLVVVGLALAGTFVAFMASWI